MSENKFASVEMPAPLARFSLAPSDGPSSTSLQRHPEGEYIRYEDHLAILNRKAPENSVEQLADETLEHVAEFFGKCVNTPNFCGFSSQISLDGLGQPATFTLTACEMIGDEPMRRLPA